jgi:catalase
VPESYKSNQLIAVCSRKENEKRQAMKEKPKKYTTTLGIPVPDGQGSLTGGAPSDSDAGRAPFGRVGPLFFIREPMKFMVFIHTHERRP